MARKPPSTARSSANFPRRPRNFVGTANHPRRPSVPPPAVTAAEPSDSLPASNARETALVQGLAASILCEQIREHCFDRGCTVKITLHSVHCRAKTESGEDEIYCTVTTADAQRRELARVGVG